MNPINFNIIDTHTKAIVGNAKTRARATRSADRRNREYGAHRYQVEAVYDPVEFALFSAIRAAILPEWA